jgi:hypothetical protein
MKMGLLLSLMLLIGCTTDPVIPPPKPQVQEISLNRGELRALLRDCKVAGVPKNDERDLEEVAVDLANARKAALEECNQRLRKARAKLQ